MYVQHLAKLAIAKWKMKTFGMKENMEMFVSAFRGIVRKSKDFINQS